jgi:hypothetical protein
VNSRAKRERWIRDGAWALVAALLPTTECLAAEGAAAAPPDAQTPAAMPADPAPARPRIPQPRIWAAPVQAGAPASTAATSPARPTIPPPRIWPEARRAEAPGPLTAAPTARPAIPPPRRFDAAPVAQSVAPAAEAADPPIARPVAPVAGAEGQPAAVGAAPAQPDRPGMEPPRELPEPGPVPDLSLIATPADRPDPVGAAAMSPADPVQPRPMPVAPPGPAAPREIAPPATGAAPTPVAPQLEIDTRALAPPAAPASGEITPSATRDPDPAPVGSQAAAVPAPSQAGETAAPAVADVQPTPVAPPVAAEPRPEASQLVAEPRPATPQISDAAPSSAVEVVAEPKPGAPAVNEESQSAATPLTTAVVSGAAPAGEEPKPAATDSSEEPLLAPVQGGQGSRPKEAQAGAETPTVATPPSTTTVPTPAPAPVAPPAEAGPGSSGAPAPAGAGSPANDQAQVPTRGIAGQGQPTPDQAPEVDLVQALSRAQAAGAGSSPPRNPLAVSLKQDGQVETTACATCGGFHGHADGPALHESMGCATGSCIPGRKPCYPPCNECDTFIGAFCQNLYQCLCCPDPCYQPGWVPAANASFFADYARPWTVTRLRYDNLEAMNRPDRNQFWINQVKGLRGNAVRINNPAARLQQFYLYQEAAAGRGSFFIEYPYRQINPNFEPTQAGFGDLNFGIKSLLFDCEMLQVTFQFRTYTPTGNSTLNLGTGHFSLDPSILTSLKLGPRTYFQGQFGNWIPLAGTQFLAGGVFYWLTSFNQVLWYTTPDSPLIATLEMDGWSFEDGGYTAALLPGNKPKFAEKGGGVSYFNIGPGLRQSVCNRLDFGGAITWATTNPHWAQPWFRFEVRFLF